MARRKWYEGYVPLGFKNLHLAPGDEVNVREGIFFWARPDRIIVIKEYPKTVLIELQYFRRSPRIPDPARSHCICIPKGALLCGDVKMRRKGGKKDLTREEVSRYEHIAGNYAE